MEALFVAVGKQGIGAGNIAYSTNGVDWAVTGAGIFDNACYGVAYNGELWVAAGWDWTEGGNTLAYSYNGIDWVGLGRDIFPEGANAVCWNGSIWVVGGEGYVDEEYGSHNIAYSYDGINWTYEPDGTTAFNAFCNKIRWNGSYFLATGNTCWYLYYSYNGINWTAVPGWYNSATRPFYDYMTDMLWDENESRWIVSGYDSAYRHNTLGYIAGDPPSSWGGWGLDPFDKRCLSLDLANDLFVACATPSTTAHTLATSNNGEDFIGLGAIAIGAGLVVSHAYIGATLIWVVGGYTAVARPYNLAYSANGTDWTSVDITDVIEDIYELDSISSGSTPPSPAAAIYIGDVIFGKAT